MTTTRARVPRIPADAERLRVPLWRRSQARVRERWGFDLDDRDALERAQAMVDEAPDDVESRVLLASVLATRGRLDEAETQARRAVDLEPRTPRAHTTLATILVQRGERDEGLKAARNAAALAMDDPHVLYNLGLAEWVAGERKTARAAFRRAQENLDAEAGAPAERPRRRWWRRPHQDAS